MKVTFTNYIVATKMELLREVNWHNLKVIKILGHSISLPKRIYLVGFKKNKDKKRVRQNHIHMKIWERFGE